MRKTGTATQPLHGGHCPPWLFARMKALGAAVVEAIVLDHGPQEVLRRFSDPVWFQSFGNVLGFDWHSSGLTTVVLAAVKEGLDGREGDVGLFFAGGKGRAARATPLDIDRLGSRYALPDQLAALKHASRMAAKVDSAAVQDGYALYHHVLVFDRQGHWTVIQQGMNEGARLARRYHWLGEALTRFTLEPHSGVAGVPAAHVLDLTAEANLPLQDASLRLAQAGPRPILDALRILAEGGARHLVLPRYHGIPAASRLDRILYRLYERAPASYEALLATEGVGAGTLRALAMVAELVAGIPVTFVDPVRYSFAHGGKDGHPFPVRTPDYDHSIEVLQQAIRRARIGDRDRLDALRRLAQARPSAL
jgi:hypothetical protein